MNPSILANFDSRTFDRLREGSKSLHAKQILPMGVISLACLTDYCAHAQVLLKGTAPSSDENAAFALTFPLNANGARWVEQYLTNMVTPHVRAWSDRHVPVKFDKREDVSSRLYIAGLVWGQCLAQEFDMRWMENPEQPLCPRLVAGDCRSRLPDVDPWVRVRRFARLGQEDGLVSFIGAMRNRPHNSALERLLDQWMQANLDQTLMNNVDRRQLWHDPEGRLQDVVLLDKHGRTLKRIVLREIEGLSLSELE